MLLEYSDDDSVRNWLLAVAGRMGGATQSSVVHERVQNNAFIEHFHLFVNKTHLLIKNLNVNLFRICEVSTTVEVQLNVTD